MCKCNEKKTHCGCNKKKETRGVDMRLIQEWDNFIGQQDPAQFGNSFAAQRGRGGIPPDNSIAVSSSKIIAMTNSVISLSEKDTLQEYFRMSLTEFYGLTLDDASPFDPWVMYEEFSNRFFVLSIADSTEGGNVLRRFYLAVSKDPKPKSLNDFYQYSWLSETPAFSSLDFPKMAIDKEAVYITYQELPNENFPAVLDWNYPIIAFEKQTLIDGSSPYEMTPIFFESIVGKSAFLSSPSEFIFPAQPHKSCGVEKVLFIAQQDDFIGPVTLSGNTFRIYNVRDVLTSPVLESWLVDVPTYSYNFLLNYVQPPPTINPDNQPIIGIDGNYQINDATIRGNSLWTIHNSLSDSDLKLARWYEIDISKLLQSGVATLKQSGTINPGNNVETGNHPSIQVDKCGNVGFNLNLIGETQYPAIGYTARLKNDPPGTVRMPIQRAADPNLYYQIAFVPGSGLNRYGDYTRIVIDPSDQKTFHLFGQRPYPADPNFEQLTNDYKVFNFGSQWTTYMGVFQAKKCGKGINAPQKTVPTAAPVSISTRSVVKSADQNEKSKEFKLKQKENFIRKINKMKDEDVKKDLLKKLDQHFKDKFNL